MAMLLPITGHVDGDEGEGSPLLRVRAMERLAEMLILILILILIPVLVLRLILTLMLIIIVK